MGNFDRCITEQDIRNKWHELAKKFHPDNVDTGDAETFKIIYAEYIKVIKESSIPQYENYDFNGKAKVVANEIEEILMTLGIKECTLILLGDRIILHFVKMISLKKMLDAYAILKQLEVGFGLVLDFTVDINVTGDRVPFRVDNGWVYITKFKNAKSFGKGEPKFVDNNYIYCTDNRHSWAVNVKAQRVVICEGSCEVLKKLINRK
ncbi:MAG: hypothetical protein LBS29_04775 [Endomicrobium sp.]|nr:hypothetical protein [Endomicrobium sp.]